MYNIVVGIATGFWIHRFLDFADKQNVFFFKGYIEFVKKQSLIVVFLNEKKTTHEYYFIFQI